MMNHENKKLIKTIITKLLNFVNYSFMMLIGIVSAIICIPLLVFIALVVAVAVFVSDGIDRLALAVHRLLDVNQEEHAEDEKG